MEIEIDLHGCHPSQITVEVLAKILRQAWESGATEIRLIHGHGRGRGISPGSVNTDWSPSAETRSKTDPRKTDAIGAIELLVEPMTGGFVLRKRFDV
jgi:hypothetical protein